MRSLIIAVALLALLVAAGCGGNAAANNRGAKASFDLGRF